MLGEIIKSGIKGLLPEFSVEWQSLTGTERDELTEDTYKDMINTDEENKNVQHSTPIAAFNDFKKTISRVENEASIFARHSLEHF